MFTCVWTGSITIALAGLGNRLGGMTVPNKNFRYRLAEFKIKVDHITYDANQELDALAKEINEKADELLRRYAPQVYDIATDGMVSPLLQRALSFAEQRRHRDPDLRGLPDYPSVTSRRSTIDALRRRRISSGKNSSAGSSSPFLSTILPSA